jgi:peptide/nickel transport system permease protein
VVVLLIAAWKFGLPMGLTFLACVAIGTLAAARSNGSYVWRKVLGLLPILIAVTFFTFCLTSLLPGDPAINILGPGATAEGIAQIHQRLHLDDPLLVRYLRWLGNAATGDLGMSPFQNKPVSNINAHALPISLQLMVYAQIVALIIAIPLGVLAAYRAESKIDRLLSNGSLFFLSVPNYVLGPLLVLFFAVGGLHWFGVDLGFHILPAARYKPFGDGALQHFKFMLLPTLSVALGQLAVYQRLLRSDMILTLKEDFINVAKAKGLSSRRILAAHALRPSAFSLLTVLGINVGFLIGNALISETIFVLPGIGGTAATAVFQRDYLVIQGAVVVVAVGYVLANFAVDLLYGVLDPRVRHARAIV